MSFLKENGIRTLVYKAIPYIYHRYPADEDLYALFRHGGQIAECNISTAVALTNPAKYNENQRLNVRKANEYGLCVAEADDFSEFWDILTFCLKDRHNASPVHSLEKSHCSRTDFRATYACSAHFPTTGWSPDA